MRARRKVTTRGVLLAGLGLVTIAVVLLRTPVAWEVSCEMLRGRLPGLLQMNVDITRCEIDPLTQSFSLRGLKLEPKSPGQPRLRVEKAELSLRALRWGGFGLHIQHIYLEKPQVEIDLRESLPKAAPTPECFTDVLQKIPVDEVKIREGSVALQLPHARALELSGIDFQSVLRRGITEFDFRSRQGKVAMGDRPDLMLGRFKAEGGLDLGEESIEVTHGDGVVEQSNLQLRGRIDELCDPTYALEGRLFVPADNLERVLKTGRTASGHLWARVTVNGKAETPIVLADVRGASLSWGDFAPGDFSARITARADRLSIDEFEAPAGDGTVKARGQVALRPGWPFEVRLDLEKAGFAEILRKSSLENSWVDFLATGQVRAKGEFNPFFLEGQVDLASEEFLLAARAYDAPRATGRDILRFDKGQLKTRVDLDAERTRFSEIDLSTGRTHFKGDVVLHHSREQGLEVEASSDSVHLGDFGEIASFSWAGAGRVQAKLWGPYNDIKVDGQVNLRDFEFWDFSLGVLQSKVTFENDVLSMPALIGQKGKSPYSGSVELDFEDGFSPRLKLEMPEGHAEDVIDLLVKQHSAFELFQNEFKGRVSATALLEGTSPRLQGKVAMTLSETTYFERSLGEGNLRLRIVDGAALVVDEAKLQGELGAFSLKGSWVFAGPLDLRFRLEECPLEDLYGRASARQQGLGGVTQWVGKVSGDSSMPQVSGYMTSPNVVFAQRALGPAHLEARLLGRDLQVWGRPFPDARATAQVKLKAPYPFSANVRLALPEIRPLLPAGAIRQGVSGALTGMAELRGQLQELESVFLDATVEKFSLTRGDFRGRIEKPVRLSLRNKRWELEAFDFRGPNTEFNLAGHWGPQTVDLKAAGALDARLLESFLPQIERTGGRIDLQVAMNGQVADPSLVGNAEIQDGRLSLKSFPVSLRNLNGRLEFSEARALLQEMSGVVNEGKATFRGDFKLANLGLERVNFGVDFEQTKLRVSEASPMTLSGTLMMQGPPKSLVLAGAIDVHKMRYSQTIDLDTFSNDVRKVPSWGTGSRTDEWLRFEVDVDVGEDVWVDNNLGLAKVSGKLKLTGTNLRPGVIGVLEAGENSRAYYRGNAFEISKGEVQFKDPKAVDIFVDLNAQTQVREFLITLKTFGRAAAPRVLLSSEPPLSEADILTLLTLGVTSRDTAITDRALSGISLAAEALLSASGLSQRVQKFLPKNNFLKDLQMYMATTYNSATRQVEPAWMMESKLLLEELKLSVVQPVSGFRGNRVQAEYRINEQLSLRAQWDNENQGYSFGNPGLDLKMRFEWE